MPPLGGAVGGLLEGLQMDVDLVRGIRVPGVRAEVPVAGTYRLLDFPDG